MINPEMFREYDIRGIAGKDMDADDVVTIGRGIGTFLLRQGNQSLTVGQDCRTTSALYAEKLIQGLTETGCDVVDIGVCPTPVAYYSIRKLRKQGNVMVTASHNPPEYNGFKICSGIDSCASVNVSYAASSHLTPTCKDRLANLWEFWSATLQRACSTSAFA